MTNVVMYSSPWCPYCTRARALLQQKGVDFEEIMVDREPQLRAEMVERSGGVTSVPQIFIGDLHVGGCDDMFALEAKGELDALLNPQPQARTSG